jgi:hypothetical protein
MPLVKEGLAGLDHFFVVTVHAPAFACEQVHVSRPCKIKAVAGSTRQPFFILQKPSLTAGTAKQAFHSFLPCGSTPARWSFFTV